MEFNKGRRRGKGNIARGMENDVSGERERMDTAIRVRKRKGEKISFKEGIILLGKSYNYHNYDLFINEFKKKKIYILNFFSYLL